MNEAEVPIRLAARLTGLAPHLIRVWEQRYQAVKPSRSKGKQRLYSKSALERLTLLRQLTLAGHSIGQVARLPTAQLRKLAATTSSAARQAPAAPRPPSPADSPVETCLAAIQALDENALKKALDQGGVTLGAQGVLLGVVAPLVRELGRLWIEGGITAAQEHFATAALRNFLSGLARPFGGTERAPRLVVATPTGQLHELGAMLVAALAANVGWRIIQLGASLPAIEIAGAARQARARAVALSLVYPEDDPDLPAELTRLRELLPAEVGLIVGGRVAAAYQEVLLRIGAIETEDLAQLPTVLTRLRRTPRQRNC